jgi:hypothetical protein
LRFKPSESVSVTCIVPANPNKNLVQTQPAPNGLRPRGTLTGAYKLGMVRAKGLEPPRLAPPEPKSGVSTISPRPPADSPNRARRDPNAALYPRRRGTTSNKRYATCRGRDAAHAAPPAQIRACAANALGSCLGCLTSNCLTYAAQRLGHAFPALCPARVSLLRILLGPRSWLHRLRTRFHGFVRRLPSYYSGVRLLPSVHHWRAAFAFPMRPLPARAWAEKRPPGFRTRSIVACLGSLTTPSRLAGSPWRP